MTLCTGTFTSQALRHDVDVTVYVPSVPGNEARPLSYDETYPRDTRYPTIYLLHGATGSHSDWSRKSTVEVYAQAAGLALLMPSAQNSFYVNAATGLRYFEFINEELPAWAESTFPLSTDRNDRYIAGLSMGAYGALRHGLATPERYAAIGAFSGPSDIVETVHTLEERGVSAIDAGAVFGGLDAIPGSDHDLFALAKRCVDSAKALPRIYLSCGTEDAMLLEQNRRLVPYLKGLGFDVVYEEFPGAHVWPVWDRSVAAFIGMVKGQ
jgi:S-formylglutathione hydrolase FrmB